jgi:ABC-type multidrug transport system permease subunit
MGTPVRAVLTLTRYQFLMLARNPAYWVSTLLLASLGIIVFGLFFSNPAGPRLGVVDEAQNEASSSFIRSVEEIDGVNVRVGDRESQLAKLQDGERWVVVVLPPSFGQDPTLRDVEIWADSNDDFSSLTGSGIVRQLLIEAIEPPGGAGIEVSEEPIGGDRPLRFIDVVLPGQVGMTLMFGNLFAATILAWWRYGGILKRVAASPVSPQQLLASQLMVFGLLSAIQATLLMTAGWLAFDVPIRGSLLLVVLVIAIGILALLSLWYVLVSLIRSPIGINAVAALVAFVMMFAGGAYLPIDDPPLWLKPVVAAAPLTYLNGALRAVMNDGAGIREIADELAILGATAAALFVVSTQRFRWTNND